MPSIYISCMATACYVSCLLQNQAGSEFLLANAEGYGQYFVYYLMSEDVNISETIAETMAIDRQNIST